MAPIVALHPERARLLAGALEDAGRELATLARAVGQDLVANGEELRPAAHVHRAAVELEDQARRLRAVIAQVETWEGPRAGARGAVRWSGLLTASHRRPHAAHGEARRVAAALRRGDTDALIALDAEWLADPVFAAVLLHALGPAALVQALDRLARSWGHPHTDPERRHAHATVAALGALLATTARAGPPAFSVADLVDAADHEHVPPAALGLLFVGTDEWSSPFLEAVVVEVVEPLNRRIVGGEAPPHAAWFGAAGRAVDVRVLVLSTVATDRSVSRELASSAGVRHLVDARSAYLDGGEALARVLEAATTPRATGDIARLAPVVTSTVRAVAAVEHLPPLLQDRLGRLASPWVGGLGGDDFGRRGTPHPLPRLGAADGAAFLEHAMARRAAAQDLRVALDAWVRATLGAVPPDAPTAPSALRHVGAVLRAVHDAERTVEAAERAASDRRNARKGTLFDHVVDAVAVPATLPAVPRLAAVVTVGSSAELLPLVLPATDAELTYLRTTPVRIAWEQERLQHRVVGAYWDRRATHGLFVEPGTAGGVRADPPPPELLGADGRLRPVEELTRSERAAFQGWLYRQDGTRLAQLVNAAGAEYGLSGAD